VNWHVSYRDGDAATRAALDAKRAEGRAELDAIGACIRAKWNGHENGQDQVSVSRSGDIHNETLTHKQIRAVADRIRALAMQNDPDALRAGLTEVADELDSWTGRGSLRVEAI
jgi:hypothetical protein